MNESSKFPPLQKAVEIIGSQTALAGVCAESTGKKIRQGHVSNWLSRHKVPPDCAAAIEREAGVKKEDLCPDYPWHLFNTEPSQEAS